MLTLALTPPALANRPDGDFTVVAVLNVHIGTCQACALASGGRGQGPRKGGHSVQAARYPSHKKMRYRSNSRMALLQEGLAATSKGLQRQRWRTFLLGSSNDHRDVQRLQPALGLNNHPLC